MRRLRRIRVLDNELPSGQISYQTKLRKCFDSEYRLVCGKLNCLVVRLLFVDAKTCYNTVRTPTLCKPDTSDRPYLFSLSTYLI
jgi:hypothetical protein